MAKAINASILIFLFNISYGETVLKQPPPRTMNQLMQTIDLSLESGYKIKPELLTYFAFQNERELLAELSSPGYAKLIHENTRKWLDNYSDTFPEVGLLYLLGGGDASTLLPYYERSSCLDFRRRCLLAFCLEDISVKPESEKSINTLGIEMTAKLSAKKNGDKVDIKLVLFNRGREGCLLFSDDDLDPSIQITRSDEVPVYYVGPLLFPNPDKDSRETVRVAKAKYSIDMTCIQPKSMIIREEQISLEKVSPTRVDTIENVYLKKHGSIYSLFGHYVSGNIKDTLKLEIRYVYDSRIMNDYLRDLGYLRFGKGKPTLHFRVESNPVNLTFDRQGKLLEVSSEEYQGLASAAPVRTGGLNDL